METALVATRKAHELVGARGSASGKRRQNLLVSLTRLCNFEEAFPEPAPAAEMVGTQSRTGDLGPIARQAEEGISLVTCAMNRTANLLEALRSWTACSEISEIVIVDWSSDEPVAQALEREEITDRRIRVFRVEGEPRWILSYAFNVGFRLARYRQILKVDADIVLKPCFFDSNPLPADAFIAGNWRRAPTGQVYINGFFFAPRAHLAAVAGFNEYITTYGWDDDDLYDRLERRGVSRIDVDADSIYHQPHTDTERTGTETEGGASALDEITGSTMYRIRRNRFLANVMPTWGNQRTHVPFALFRAQDGGTVLKRSEAVPHAVPSQIEADADYYALLELVSWRLGPDIWQLDRASLRGLLAHPFAELGPAKIKAAMARQDAPGIGAPVVAPVRARLFIDAQHGLGNRLRAIGSAAAIAEATDRELVIVWQPDSHCEGRLADLFDHDGAVIEETFVHDAAPKGCKVYNYMEIEEGAAKDAPIDLGWTGDIYARAAYVLNATAVSKWESENRFLRGLTPVAEVRALVAGVRTPNDVALHVRMVGAKGTDTAVYDRADNWTAEGHAAINHWRGQSHYARFMTRLDALIAEGRANRVFLAADAPETYAAFAETYGDRIACLPRALYDRSAEQLRYALADALLLGSAPRLLGSTWSSFSELAMRLSPQKMEIEMSGKDF